jgi:hypothetical protein
MPLGVELEVEGTCAEDVWKPNDLLVHFAGGRNAKQLMLNEFSTLNHSVTSRYASSGIIDASPSITFLE